MLFLLLLQGAQFEIFVITLSFTTYTKYTCLDILGIRHFSSFQAKRNVAKKETASVAEEHGLEHEEDQS